MDAAALPSRTVAPDTTLRAVLQAAPVAIVAVDAEQRTLIWNPAAEQIFGWRAAEVLGRVPPIFPAGRAEESLLMLQQALRGESSSGVETRRLRKDGAEVEVSLSLAPLAAADGQIIGAVAAYVDISERMRVSRALQSSEERYELIVRATADAVWDWDLATQEVRWNQGLRLVFGYPDEALRRHSWWMSNVHPEDVTAAQASVEAALAAGERFWSGEYRFRRLDGTYAYVLDRGYILRDEQGTPTRMIGAMVDISDRKRAAEAIAEREQQYRSVFESVDDGLVIHTLDGRRVDFNPAAARLQGYSVEEYCNLAPQELIEPASWPRFQHMQAIVARGQEFRTQSILRRKDGSVFAASVRGIPFAYRGSRHVLVIVHDMSEEAAAYRLLEERVEERTRELTTLLSVSRDIAVTLDLGTLLGLILDQLRTVVDYQGASVLDRDGDVLRGRAYRGPKPPGWIRGFQMPLDNFIDSQVLASRQPYIIHDMQEDSPATRYFRDTLGAEFDVLYAGVRSWARIPLIARDRVVGMLTLHRPQPHAFASREIDLAAAFADQAAIAIENARLYDQAQALAAVEERQRLARELHDSVSQALYGIALGARTARIQLDREPVKAAAPLDYVLQLAEAGMAEMRALIFELRPESLAQEGLVAALTKQAAALRARHQIVVTTDLAAEPDVSLESKEALYRIAQEALHNVVKHARARSITVRLAQSGSLLRLEVQDDGQGFDPAGEFPGHLGLKSMQERAARLGGSVTLDSAPSGGTRVEARVPA